LGKVAYGFVVPDRLTVIVAPAQAGSRVAAAVNVPMFTPGEVLLGAMLVSVPSDGENDKALVLHAGEAVIDDAERAVTFSVTAVLLVMVAMTGPGVPGTTAEPPVPAMSVTASEVVGDPIVE
jgi:hypothetical protein